MESDVAAVLNTPLAKDPVCGMNVNPQTAKWKTQHQGKTYYGAGGGAGGFSPR